MVINLDNRSLIKVSGKDAGSFLQSQFTNDINRLSFDELQITAYCQHQGKVIAILWIFQRNNSFYLSIPKDITEIVIQKLKIFKLLSDVEIVDFSSNLKQYGIIGENFDNSLRFKNNLSLLTTRKSLDNLSDIGYWEEACIKNLIPEVNHINSEKFIPQSLNLDINEFGVSFSKGCYPGQEVVARMHYLGKPKRRLASFTTVSEVKIGDTLTSEKSNSLKASGEVIRAINIGQYFLVLASIEIKYLNDQIFINNNKNQKLNLINE